MVVENEAKVAQALKEGPESEHSEVAVARTGEDGFFHADAEGVRSDRTECDVARAGWD